MARRDGRLDRKSERAAEAGREPEGVEPLFRLLVSLFRDLALLRSGAPEKVLVHLDLVSRLRPLAETYGAAAPAIIDRLEEAARRTRGNVNPRLAAEAVLIPLVSSR